MKLTSLEEIEAQEETLAGATCMFYGETGRGKTTTCLLEAFRMAQRLNSRVLYIQTEIRNLKPTLDVVRSIEPDFDFDVLVHENVRDTIDTMNTMDFSKYKVAILDSFTDFMGLQLLPELKSEANDVRSDKDSGAKNTNKAKKDLIMASKGSQEIYQAVSDWTIRLTTAFNNMSCSGIYMVGICRDEENPSWNTMLSHAPLLKGKDYGKSFKGMFDKIGYVTPNIKDGKEIYPPLVTFKSIDDDFIAKWSGLNPVNKKGEQVEPIGMPLRFDLIFGE